MSVGVIDTHFETTHEDLNGQFITVLGSNSPTVYEAWHGTGVAGCINAITDNGIGLSGLGFNSKVYASTNRGDSEVLVLAQSGYRVINCSWFNSCSYSVVQDSLYNTILNTYNTLVTFGAGNGTNHCGSLTAQTYPSALPANICVTSIGSGVQRGTVDPIYGQVGWFDCHENVVGNPASTHHHYPEVDICAPGYNVAIVADQTLSLGKYTGGWGTSFAAPKVAAAIGLILSINPCLSANQARDVVLNTSNNIVNTIPENAAYVGLIGQGRLDVNSALQQAALTATINYSSPTTLSGTQTIRSNYAIRNSSSVTITSGSNIIFQTRK